uniref:Uncharacterized protein n=1 Tax=viral metagenome TaxID=1070528 RepID=A0A6C0LPL4_9ZZZZ
MLSYFNSLIYKTNTIKHPNEIHKFQHFMMTIDNKEKIINESVFAMRKNEEKAPEKLIDIKMETPVESSIEDIDQEECVIQPREQRSLITPRQPDTLFWCLYIIRYGYNDYVQIDRNYGVKELEEKQKILEFVKENKVNMKNTNYKITNVAIQEIMSELMTQQKQTSFLCLTAISVYYNINLLIINEKTKCMLEFWVNKERVSDAFHDDNTFTYLLYKDEFGKYSVQIEYIPSSKIIELREKYIVLEQYNKYLKALSNYRLEDLENLAKKLNVYDSTVKYKKGDLYEIVGNALGI